MVLPAGHPIFTAQLSHLNGHAEITLVGELDAATVGVLQHILDDVLAHPVADLRLNASALTFLDAAGIGCFVRAHQQALAAGGSLRIESLHGAPRRVLQICDLLHTFAPEPTGTRPDSSTRPTANAPSRPGDRNR